MNKPPVRIRFGLVEWCLFGGVVVLGILLVLPRVGAPLSVASGSADAPVQQPSSAGGNAAPASWRAPAEWGIEVVALHSAVNGRVIDLRYKILDLEKAALLPNDPGGIYLIDEASGETSKLPNAMKTGSIPQNPQKLQVGRTYSLSFPNPGERLKSGNKITLVMGSLRAENLILQ